MRRTLRVDVLLAKGRAHAELPDELERAIPLLDQALSLDPTRIDVRTELALALAQWHRSERAAELVQEALDDAAGADRCELLFALGMVRRAELNDAEAEACFRTVLADHPDHSRAAAALAGCWMRSGRSDEARQLLAASLARDPDDVRALFVLAELEMTEGAADRSEAALRAILAVNPASLKALYMLSRSLAMQGREEEQLAILQSYSERRGQLASR
jgi:tetratricopeptide (TPR) repeat protein